MKSSEDIVGERFHELVKRRAKDITGFTYAEKATWLIVIIRSEIDINSFEDVFVQALSLNEMRVAISIMKKLELEVATKYERVLDLLVANEFYYEDGNAKIKFNGLPADVMKEIEGLSNEIMEGGEGGSLWGIDDKLAELYKNE